MGAVGVEDEKRRKLTQLRAPTVGGYQHTATSRYPALGTFYFLSSFSEG